MLLLLVSVLFIVSLVLLFSKKNKETFNLMSLCLSLLLMFFGVMLFIAKKGGFSPDIMQFFFFTDEIKTYMQYFYITLSQLGYLIALGRYLFPYIFLVSSLQYAFSEKCKNKTMVQIIAAILPVLSLIIYFPTIFRSIISRFPNLQDLFVNISYFWIMAYVIIGLILLTGKFIQFKTPFLKIKFGFIALSYGSLAVLYLLYCSQDPSQVYRFYSFDYIWSRGIGYLQYAPTFRGYLTILVVTLFGFLLGVISILRFTRESYVENREEYILENKFSVASSGASVFTHSIKNQLLANNVLYKRLNNILNKEDLESNDLEKIKEYIDRLKDNNDQILVRTNKLYEAAKSKSIQLKPILWEEVYDEIVLKFFGKYPEGNLETLKNENFILFADKSYLSEAVYNLLTNAWEACLLSNKENKKIYLSAYMEDEYIVISVKDDGDGLTKKEQRKIFDPFYSQKNTNTNWGLGLSHVQSIIRQHQGQIKLRSQVGRGTTFYLLLPRFEKNGG